MRWHFDDAERGVGIADALAFNVRQYLRCLGGNDVSHACEQIDVAQVFRMEEKLDLDVARLQNPPVEGRGKQADLVHRRRGAKSKSPPAFAALLVGFVEAASNMPLRRNVHGKVDVEEIAWLPRRIFAPVVRTCSGKPQRRRHQRDVGAVEEQRFGA